MAVKLEEQDFFGLYMLQIRVVFCLIAEGCGWAVAWIDLCFGRKDEQFGSDIADESVVVGGQ